MARAKSPPEKPKCVNCRRRVAVSRRCCGTCLRNVHRMIETGELTESDAIDKGLIGPRKKTGRPLGNAVRSRLARMSR